MGERPDVEETFSSLSAPGSTTQRGTSGQDFSCSERPTKGGRFRGFRRRLVLGR